MPSSTLLAAAEAAPPPRRRRRRAPLESVTVHISVFRSLVLPSRHWAGLPPELISSILHRLDPVQIMLGADMVCRSWRRAARDEPELWRRIDMRGYEALSDRKLIDLDQMAIEAVRRSQGQCRAFWGEGYGLHDVVLRCLADHAQSLKSLTLVSCYNVSDQGLMQAIRRMPLLQELELSCCGRLELPGVFEVVAKECPQLKHLINRQASSFPLSYYQEGGGTGSRADGEAMAIAKMHELRSLQLVCNDLTNQGLESILDKCLHLESLCIRNCCNISMTHKMRARIKTKRLLVNYVDDREREDFEPSSPDTECSTCHNYFGSHKEGYQKPYVNDMEAMVISTVCKLRSVQLYRNDLTSEGLAAILEQCPRLEFLDVCNCLNIVRDSSLGPKYGWIKTKKLTIRLLTDYSNHRFFNPKALDIHNCRNIILNDYRDIFIYNAWKGAKYNRILLRKMTINYHRRTKKMMSTIEKYMANLNIVNFDYKDFDGAEFDSYRYFKPKEYNHERECSTCLMLEYFAEHWGVLDLDDYADYYDPSYGLDGHDEIDFGVHDRMIDKKLHRYT